MSHIWHEVKVALAKRIPEHTFRMWIDPLKLENVENDKLKLSCPNQFFRKRIVDNFSHAICTELKRIVGQSMQLEIQVTAVDDIVHEPIDIPRPQQMPLPDMTIQSNYGRLLRNDYTFDRFVVGKSNDFAYSAALSLAARGNTEQHSLFLLSSTGMGKSHLSQAIGHHILSQSPRDRVYYMTAEDFTNEMVASYKSNSLDVFKNKYHQNCDVLLLEDIQYLSGKDRTQIELAHTLDSLFNHNKKIIFSSCHSPSEIPKLNENLRSRLTGGLISNIDPPTYSMRMKILKIYAAQSKWTIPKDVQEYLASELTQDIRQLKSGLLGVVTKASLLGKKVNLTLAASIIKNMIQKRENITIGSIIKLVCKYYNLTPKELVSRSRKQAIVRPRQVAIYLSRKFTDQPLQAIGKSFNRYHATALHAIGMVEKSMRQGGPIQGHVEYLTKKLESGDY